MNKHQTVAAQAVIQKTLKNEAGFTLIDMLIFSAILAAMIAGFSSYQASKTQQRNIQTIRKDYRTLQDSVENTARQISALSESEDLQLANLGSFPTSPANTSPTPSDEEIDAEILNANIPTGLTCPTGCYVAVDALGNSYCAVTATTCSAGPVCPAGCNYATSTTGPAGANPGAGPAAALPGS